MVSFDERSYTNPYDNVRNASWKEIKSLAGKGNIFTFRVTNGNGYSTHTINGLGAPGVS